MAKYSDVISDGGFDPRYTAPPKREWVGLTDADIANLRYSGAQPEREWVGLTDEEIMEAWKQIFEPGHTIYAIAKQMAMTIEAKLKEKNT